jgi:DNA repair exonuclease SbcCD ATPase subunit
VHKSANEQKDVFMRGQSALKERMAHLEESMKKKQNEIGELTEVQTQTQKIAENYRIRMSESERECTSLREQLQKLGSARQTETAEAAEEAVEEIVRRVEYESKLAKAEEQLREVERDRVRFVKAERERILSEEKSNYESKKAADHVLELETFRSGERVYGYIMIG